MPQTTPNPTGTMHFFALLIRCPFGEAACHCPFNAIRDRVSCLEHGFTEAERLAGDDQRAQQAWERHTHCLRRRLNRVSASLPMPQTRPGLERHATC